MTHTDEREDTGLSYARVMLVGQRAPGATPDADLLKLARSRAPDPAVLDEYPPYFFPGEISSSRFDSYDTAMAPDTLRNFAADAAEGVSFLRNHNYREDPIGHSLTGRFVGGGGDGVARTEAEFWLPTDPATTPYVTKLRSGVVRYLSVGFYDGQWICTICGRDMEQWMSAEGCPHLLGVMYTPQDAAGEQKGEPVKARAVIHNSRLAEVSGVYKGSTPGAMVKKALGMAQEGLLCGTERELVQARYHIALPEHARQYGGVTLAPEETKMPETPAGQTTPETEGLRFPDGRLVTLTDVRTLEQRLGDFHASAEAAADAPAGAGPVETVRWLIAERTRLLPLEAETARLRPLAADGEAYRADLVEDALKEGVRAQGNEFARETYEGVLRSAPLATVKRMRDDWKAIGDRALPGGRLTTDGPGQPTEKLTDRAPAGAYAA